MAGVAGVPPDYFNETGQLWGMPLFDWESMARDGYTWWLNRLGKNLEWFDLLRLDHFRGFSAFWEVPPDAENALNGKWVKGPGKKFFDALRKKFPEMPFVAEDLGEIDQSVYDLRDEFGLPGMKIVQFGFGENMPFLEHNPLNYPYNSVAYTGTHDNNTVKGWVRQETDEDMLNRIMRYQGKRLTKKYAHMDMIRFAYASNARLVIIPMQDWLGLEENSRMNYPSTVKGNWIWKIKSEELTSKLQEQIGGYVKTFGRY
jgi:4-alpha-glucanotransferase